MNLQGDSDRLSEASETGSSNSEAQKDLATRIGVHVSELHQERFSVDRRKLVQMLTGDNEEPPSADNFFHKIMEDTNTIIHWPSKIKVGQILRIYPRVTIFGLPKNIQIAKKRVLDVLDINRDHVTLKMDVNYKDHAYIIGSDGLKIKPVMDESHCHIHFPYLNLVCATERSNQVSITGDIRNIDRARSLIRNMSPIRFSFELFKSNSRVTPNINSSYVNKVRKQYSVDVTLEHNANPRRTFVIVKGAEDEIRQVKQATVLLMEFMCGDLSDQGLVQLTMEILPHHHDIVAGRNYANLNAIIKNTQTHITFPDARNPSIPSYKKSNVLIRGNIDGVYLARQQLVGSLPLVLIFNLSKELQYTLDPEKLAKIQSDLGVTITIRRKKKQNCAIKGMERYATNIYEARNRVLEINEPGVIADIPLSYTIPHFEGTSEVTSTMNVQPHMCQPFIEVTPLVGIIPQPQVTYNDMYYNLPGPSGLGQFSSSTVSLERSSDESYSVRSSTCSMPSPTACPWAISSPYSDAVTPTDSPVLELSYVLSDTSNSPQNYYQHRIDGLWQSFTPPDFNQKRDECRRSFTTPDFDQNRAEDPQAFTTPDFDQRRDEYRQVLPLPDVDQLHHEYRQPFTTPDFDQNRAEYPQASSTPDFDQRRDEYRQVLPPSDFDQLHNEYRQSVTTPDFYQKRDEYRRSFTTSDFDQIGEDYRQSFTTPDFDQIRDEYRQAFTFPDFDKKRVAGFRAMYIGQVAGYRVPTNTWSGYGISYTSPGALQLYDQDESIRHQEVADPLTTLLNRSNILESTPVSMIDQIINSTWSDLPSMFASLGLEKYIRLFKSHEIDLVIFPSLSELDLIKLGVTAFGARQKMMLVASEMNNRSSPFSAIPVTETRNE